MNGIGWTIYDFLTGVVIIIIMVLVYKYYFKNLYVKRLLQLDKQIRLLVDQNEKLLAENKYLDDCMKTDLDVDQ